MVILDIPMVCTGCGTTQRLSQSHIIPRSRRSDLKEVKENITWHCLSIGEIVGCHQKHESLEVVHLHDFEANMKYVKQVDEEYFWLRFHRLLDRYKDDKKLLKKINKLIE